MLIMWQEIQALDFGKALKKLPKSIRGEKETILSEKN